MCVHGRSGGSLLVLVLAPAIGLGCGTSGTARRPGAASAGRPAAAEPTVTESAPGNDVLDDDAVVRRLCDERTGCTSRGVRREGTDPQGNALWSVTLSLPATAEEWCDVVGDPDGGADEQALRDGPGPTEHWLVVARGSRVQSVQLLLRLCNDGYGAAGVGEDRVELARGRLSYSRGGGSAWRWDSSWLVQLSPLAILEESGGGDWTLGPNHERSRWSWVEFAGEVEWSSPFCDPCGNPPSFDEPCDQAPPSGEAGESQTSYVQIPQVELPQGFAEGDWRTATLGACSTIVDGDEHGYTVHGAISGPSDASMRVVASATGALFVEVHDDRFVTGSRRWIHDDHVELWVSSTAHDYMEHCIGPRPATAGLLQWGVRISDAAIQPGHGRPRQPLVAATAVEGVIARLRIELPQGARGVTVVYSDGDDGRSQESLIATSTLRFGHVESLGALRPITREEAVCELREGRLEPRITREFSPDEPVIGWD